MGECYLKTPLKSATTEEKAEFVKKYKQHLILPFDDVITDVWIDGLVKAIKNNWLNGGIEAHMQLSNMYSALKKVGYE
jgi:hypothetical protein